MSDAETARKEVIGWFERVVLGLELCPFAARPWREGAIRFAVTEENEEIALLQALESELQWLDEQPETETTLLILPRALADFSEYNDFLDRVDELLRTGGWEGRYQVASFHPDYRFADSLGEDDPADWSNRSPYPLLHLIREDSLERALAAHPDPEAIPERNVRLLRGLNRDQMRALFGARYDG